MQIEELQTVDGGRTALVTQNVLPVVPRDLGRLRIVLLDPAERCDPARRRAAHPGQARLLQRDVSAARLGRASGDRPVAPLLGALRYRMSLLDLGAG